jgi:hypothetical protein
MEATPPGCIERKDVTSYTLLEMMSQQLVRELCVATCSAVRPDKVGVGVDAGAGETVGVEVGDGMGVGIEVTDEVGAEAKVEV